MYALGCTERYALSLFQHRLSGETEPRRRFTLSGRQLFSALAERGTRTAQACSPLTGGSLFQHRPNGVLEPRTRFTLSGRQSFSLRFSGELRSAERGNVPRPAAGQEGRHQGFYPLNSHFLLGESGADCLYVTASKWGNGSRVTLAFVSQNIRSDG